MIIDTIENTTIITQEKASASEFVKKLNLLYPKFHNQNIIVNLNNLNPFTEQEIAEFLELSNQHKKAKHSFVLVSNTVNPEDIPEALIVVPTLQEAYDIIEMEEIERDLGL